MFRIRLNPLETSSKMQVCAGCMAEVHVASSQLDASGRLSVRAGDKLELAPGPDADWMWARCGPGAEEGWVPRSALDCVRMQPGHGVGTRVIAERADGYIATRVGDVVMVTHIEVDALASWAYVILIHSRKGLLCPQGWVRRDSLRQWAAPQSSPGDQPRPRAHLRIVTFGLENCNAELAAHCKSLRYGGAFAQVPDATLRAALGRMGYPSVNVLCDCRIFPDYGQERLRGHPGGHPVTVAQVARHDNFRPLLRSIHEQWGAPSTESARVMAFFCKSGKHRSVAVATILKRICEEEGLEVDLRHLSCTRWHGQHGSCAACCAPSADRDNALAWAQYYWRAAPVR